MKNIINATLITLALCGCSSSDVDVKYIAPTKYTNIASYLNDTFEGSNCIGTIFTSQGNKLIDSSGLKYELKGRNIRCYNRSIENAINRYCIAKGGRMTQGDLWCRVNKEPLFYVNYGSKNSRLGLSSQNFFSVERSGSQTKQQWIDSAERLGFISERIQQQKELDSMNLKIKDDHEKQLKIKEMNVPVNASVGDLICRKDYEAKPYQYPGIAYYKAYVERKENNKLQLRLVWHGGDGFVVNDISTINNIIWSSPNGWKHCD